MVSEWLYVSASKKCLKPGHLQDLLHGKAGTPHSCISSSTHFCDEVGGIKSIVGIWSQTPWLSQFQ
jgi:hypothetical protein